MQENGAKISTATLQARQDAEKLRAFLNSVPYGELRAVVAALQKACMVPAYTLANWRSGRCRIPELHKAKINEVANRQVF